MTEEDFKKEQEETLRGQEIAKIKGELWLAKGKELIYPERYPEYEETIKSVVNSGRYGIECMDSALEVIEYISMDGSIDNAVTLFKDKELDGSIALNAENLILHFSPKGPEFVDAYYDSVGYEPSEDRRENIETIREQNKEFAGKHLN